MRAARAMVAQRPMLDQLRMSPTYGKKINSYYCQFSLTVLISERMAPLVTHK